MPHIHEPYDHTVSAFVLHPSQRKILLIAHKKMGKFLQPGGHIELNEDPIQALTHELREECGLDLKRCEMLLQPDQPRPSMPKYKYVTLPIPFHHMAHDSKLGSIHRHIDIEYALRSYTDKITPERCESQDFD